MEFQATHKPLYGFHLLQKKHIIKLDKLMQKILVTQFECHSLYITGVNETHLILLI